MNKSNLPNDVKRDFKGRHKVLMYVATISILIIVFLIGLLLMVAAHHWIANPFWKVLAEKAGEVLCTVSVMILIIELFFVVHLIQHVQDTIIHVILKPVLGQVSGLARKQMMLAEAIGNLQKVMESVTNMERAVSLRLKELRADFESIGDVIDNQLDPLKKLLGQFVLSSKFGDFGIVDVIPSASFSNFFDAAPAGTTVFVRNTCIMDRGDWEARLLEALRRGVNVKMLVVSPKGKVARYRAHQLAQQMPNFQPELDAFLRRMRSLASRQEAGLTGKFEVREYDEPTNFPVFLIDSDKPTERRAWMSIFTDVPTEPTFPHFELQWGGDFLESIIRDVKRVWDDNPHRTEARAA